MKKLPKAIAAYIKASNNKDASAFTKIFTADATFFDDGKTYSGMAEITKWKTGFDQQFTISSELVDFLKESDNQYTVDIRFTGNFAGSPQVFKHFVVLEGDQIKNMKVG